MTTHDRDDFERTVWRGSPSLRSTAFLWAIAAAIMWGAETHLIPTTPSLAPFVPDGALPAWVLPLLKTRLLVAAVALFYPVSRTLSLLSTEYAVTDERIVLSTGVFSRRYEQIEFYRVRDVSVTRSLHDRIIGVGTVDVYSTDATMPECRMSAVIAPLALADEIRRLTTKARRRLGVREFEVH